LSLTVIVATNVVKTLVLVVVVVCVDSLETTLGTVFPGADEEMLPELLTIVLLLTPGVATSEGDMLAGRVRIVVFGVPQAELLTRVFGEPATLTARIGTVMYFVTSSVTVMTFSVEVT